MIFDLWLNLWVSSGCDYCTVYRLVVACLQ